MVSRSRLGSCGTTVLGLITRTRSKIPYAQTGASRSACRLSLEIVRIVDQLPYKTWHLLLLVIFVIKVFLPIFVLVRRQRSHDFPVVDRPIADGRVQSLRCHQSTGANGWTVAQ